MQMAGDPRLQSHPPIYPLPLPPPEAITPIDKIAVSIVMRLGLMNGVVCRSDTVMSRVEFVLVKNILLRIGQAKMKQIAEQVDGWYPKIDTDAIKQLNEWFGSSSST